MRAVIKLYSVNPFAQIADDVFDGVPVTVYSPREPKNELTGGLVVLHGGGFMAGGARKALFTHNEIWPDILARNFHRNYFIQENRFLMEMGSSPI